MWYSLNLKRRLWRLKMHFTRKVFLVCVWVGISEVKRKWIKLMASLFQIFQLLHHLIYTSETWLLQLITRTIKWYLKACKYEVLKHGFPIYSNSFLLLHVGFWWILNLIDYVLHLIVLDHYFFSVECQTAAIRAIRDVEIEHLKNMLRLLRSNFSNEQLQVPVMQFFEENFPNLAIVRNEKNGQYEVQQKDIDGNLSMDQFDGRNLHTSLLQNMSMVYPDCSSAMPSLGGFEFSNKSGIFESLFTHPCMKMLDTQVYFCWLNLTTFWQLKQPSMVSKTSRSRNLYVLLRFVLLLPAVYVMVKFMSQYQFSSNLGCIWPLFWLYG